MIAQEREKREAERKARDKRARIVREQQELKEAQEQLARLGQEDKQAAEEEAEKAFQAELLKRAARSRAQERAELEKKALFAKCNQVSGFSAEFVPLNSSVHQVFEAIDTNSDGSLTRAEVIRGLKTSSNVSPLVPSVCC